MPDTQNGSKKTVKDTTHTKENGGLQINLRDYFAARILTTYAETEGIDNAKWVAETAYAFADAMLEARAK